jgi:hypothetical protein
MSLRKKRVPSFSLISFSGSVLTQKVVKLFATFFPFKSSTHRHGLRENAISTRSFARKLRIFSGMLIARF